MTSVTGNGVGMASRKIAATTTSSSSSSSSSSSRRKNVTTPLVNRMFEQVLSTISKPSDDRINSDITMIAAWLSKRFDVFKQLNQGVVVKLLKYCEYQRVVRDQIITRQGEKGDCFYIQLTGKTSLYIDMTKALINQQVAPEPPAPTTAADVQLDDQISDEWIEEWDGKGHKRMKLDRSKFGHFIKNFDAGKGFGELALLTENAVRSGSIIADDVTDLLVIRKQLFDDTLKSKQEDEFRERKGFIDGSALFANWMPQLKRLLEISLRKEFFPYGSFIVRQCQRVTGLLFIIRSEFVTGARLDKASGAPRSSPATTMTTTSPTGTASDGFLRLKGHFPAEQRPTTSKVKSICFIGQGEIIGAMELIAGLTSHAHNVVATRDTEVFVLDNRNIDRIICHNKLTPTIDTLYKTVIDKLQLRATSTVSQQCELYRILLGKLMGRRPSIDVSKQVPSTDGDIDVQTSSQTTSGGGVAGTGQYDDDRYTSSLLQQAAAGRQGPLHPLSKQPESTSFDVAKLRYRTKICALHTT